MSRHQAITQTLACFDDGRFQQVLARRVAMRTESQDEVLTIPNGAVGLY